MWNMLFRPIDYLLIKWAIDSDDDEANLKAWFDWLIPFFFACLVSILFIVAEIYGSGSKVFFSSKGFDLIGNFTQTMPGFYFAALTAIISLNNPKLEITPDVNAPHNKAGDLCIRFFLAKSFSYLTFLSFFLFFYSVISGFFYDASVLYFGLTVFRYVYFFALFFFFFFFFQMFFITCMTLYFVGHYMHKN